MPNLKKFNDVFDIEERLKEIDSSYKLFFNADTKKYEVYSDKNGKLMLAFICPYGYPDARIISYARRTRIERHNEIIAEIEENNKKIEKNATENAFSEEKSKLASIVNYLKKR